MSLGQMEEILEGKWFEVEKWLGEVKVVGGAGVVGKGQVGTPQVPVR